MSLTFTQRIGRLAKSCRRRLSGTPGAPAGSIIDISDEFVNWICFANAGMLQRGNLYCFDYAIRNLPGPAPMLEIGSFCGLSTNLMTYYKQKHGVTNPLLTCDKWIFEGATRGTLGNSSVSHTQYREFVRESFLRNVRLFSGKDLPYTVELTSDEFFEAWRQQRQVTDVFARPVRLGGAISFCYIDGNHSYDFARRDFENCDRYLDRGGFVLFDDSADGTPFEVARVVAEIQRDARYELVIKNPNYLFRKK